MVLPASAGFFSSEERDRQLLVMAVDEFRPIADVRCLQNQSFGTASFEVQLGVAAGVQQRVACTYSGHELLTSDQKQRGPSTTSICSTLGPKSRQQPLHSP